MNKDLEVFENRHDDWLAKERQYEESVSAWDFDEGRKIKNNHIKNCEANKIKVDHAKRHAAYNNNRENNNNQFQEIDSKKFGKIFIPLFIFVVAISLIGILVDSSIISEDSFLAVPIILFIIFVNIFKDKKGRK